VSLSLKFIDSPQAQSDSNGPKICTLKGSIDYRGIKSFVQRYRWNWKPERTGPSRAVYQSRILGIRRLGVSRGYAAKTAAKANMSDQFKI